MKEETLNKQIIEAFKEVPFPEDQQTVTKCECEECLGLRRNFKQETTDGELFRLIELNYSHLPLFSPAAFHYFLPKYMLYSMKRPDSDVCEHTLFTLSPSEGSTGVEEWKERLTFFSEEQIESIISFLRFLREKFKKRGEYRLYEKDFDKGLLFWGKLIK